MARLVDEHKHADNRDKPCRACALEKAHKLGMDRILVPLDGSVGAEQALPYAAMAAKWLGAELTLLHVVHPGPPFLHYRPGQVRYPDAPHDRSVALATAYLREIAARLAAVGVDARWGIADGEAAQMICARATTGGYGLTVLAVHTPAPLGRLFSPSFLDQVWKGVAAPILLVRQHRQGLNPEPISKEPREFIVPYGRDPGASEAVPIAAALAGASGASVTMMTSMVTVRRKRRAEMAGESGAAGVVGWMQEAAAYLKEDRLQVRVETRDGIPARAISARQAESPGSWVVMTSVMLTGAARTIFGSTADGVLRSAPGPVLIAPASAVAHKRAAQAQAALEQATLSLTG